MANYNEAFGKQFVRVPSCNTTALIRTLNVLDKLAGIKEVVVTIVRRADDPPDSEKTLMNTVKPEVKIPSHHGPDVKTVLHNLNIKTIAIKAPTTLAHVHVIHAKINKKIKTEDLKGVFKNTPRIILLKEADGYTSTAIVMERFRDLGRFRNDMPEVVIWDESVNIEGEDVFWMHMVHSESIIVPENVDCIRAMFGIEKDNWKSIEKTNKSLGIK
jgi:glyceraldehyde-3-phosphate dehydrogenase (NAD(P))